MTTRAIAAARPATGLLPILSALILGLGLVFAAGFSNAAGMHDIAHDSRHATGFPCH